jgi:subtilase family serine protease|tara:strand:- start:109 stop:240 length:132 start_codon:yes stop_codon:yes gene_type:complete
LDTAGTHTFTAIVDEYDEVSELNENNNQLTKVLIVANTTNSTG